MSVELDLDFEFSAPKMNQDWREHLERRLKTERNFDLNCIPGCIVELMVGLARWDILAKNRIPDEESDDREEIDALTSNNFTLVCCMPLDINDVKKLTALIGRWNAQAIGSYKGGFEKVRIEWYIKPNHYHFDPDKVAPILRPELKPDTVDLVIEDYKKEVRRLGEWLQDLEGNTFVKHC